MLPALAVLLQIAIPVPSGYVNDFAAVLDPASIAHMDAVIREVNDKTRGEIAVVTLSDQPPPPPPPLPPADDSGGLPIPLSWLIGAAVLLIILTRGRVLLLPFYFGATFGGSGGWRGSSGGWGGGWGGGGGGGGGFG